MDSTVSINVFIHTERLKNNSKLNNVTTKKTPKTGNEPWRFLKYCFHVDTSFFSIQPEFTKHKQINTELYV